MDARFRANAVVHVPDPSNDAVRETASDAAVHAPPTASAQATAPAAPRRLEGGKPVPPADAPRPIGMDRLRALREAIRNGTYPTDADVVGGLVRMFGEPDAPAAPEPKAD
jgi:anti-sigma28 factor (negative regulator of flagellin synthesis)